MHSTAYKSYITILLLMVYICKQTDRAVFGFVMEPIKREFALSDTQIGFLAGPALAVFYALLGVPVARLADRYNRINIMTTAATLWSGIVMLSATVGGFWHLALARIGVGVGEAGFTAVAQSVISDYHSGAQRTRAISIFMLAIPLSGVVSGLLAGWVNDAWGWRAVFIVAGLPGIALAVLMKTTIREPQRHQLALQAPPSDSRQTPPPLVSVFAFLWRQRTLRHMTIAMALVNLAYGMVFSWLPVFFARVHDLSTGEAGTGLAVIYGVGGSAGIWLGGYLTNQFEEKDSHRQLWLIAMATALLPPALLIMLWSSSAQLTWLALFPAYILILFCFAPTSSLLLGLCESSMRTTVASISIMVQQIALAIVGVQLTGVLSDVMTSMTDDSVVGLRGAMTVASPLAIWAAVHFWIAGCALRGDSAACERASGAA